MTLIYKRPDSPIWYVRKTRESTGTTNRKLAEEHAKTVWERLWREKKLGTTIRTWDELVTHWLDMRGSKNSIKTDRAIIADFENYIRPRGLEALPDIDDDVISGYRILVKARASEATANRHLACIRAMLNQAKAKKWINEVPAFEMYPKKPAIPRGITLEQFAEVVEYLPAWAADLATFALHTGLRFSNVAEFRREWADPCLTTARVPATKTKTKRWYAFPLSLKAREILLRREIIRSNGPLMFSRPDGLTITAANYRYWWERACEAAGVTCRFHDLRHTWASLHMMNGTPAQVIQEMAGWASGAMLQNYAHLNKAHLAKYADNIG